MRSFRLVFARFRGLCELGRVWVSRFGVRVNFVLWRVWLIQVLWREWVSVCG